MGTVMQVHYAGSSCKPRLNLRFPSFRVICSSELSVSRRQVLKQVDEELGKGDERAALSLVKDLQGKPGGLRCFGAARQVFPNSHSVHSVLYSLTPKKCFQKAFELCEQKCFLERISERDRALMLRCSNRKMNGISLCRYPKGFTPWMS